MSSRTWDVRNSIVRGVLSAVICDKMIQANEMFLMDKMIERIMMNVCDGMSSSWRNIASTFLTKSKQI